MDTNKLKKFAQEARNILLTGVVQRLSTLGINPDGITERPQVMGGGATFKGKTVGLDFVKTWQSIAHNVESRGYRVVAEEAAYTWFNRLIAIRIMAKNGLIEPLLKYESETVHIPFIVTEARHGRLPQFTAEQQTQWDAIANDDSKTDDQFILLISAWCDNNPIIKAAFGCLDDYSFMLIPSNILKDDGFVDMLNKADYLTDEDYRSPELIGWLYQFYISERKDEVFAKKGKYDSDEIPAATQIFTPNWIVKYMVQNTLGRIYLDANPWETELQKDWKYLVDTPEGYDERKNTQMLELENLRTGDLACGSGHILNEQFGILYSMYLNDGYSPRNAIESIFRKNIVGIDIDLRAKQLATFSLLLKSCQIDKSLASAPVVPRVYSMPHIEAVPHLEYPNPNIKEEVEACFKLMVDAETLGSIMKFDISDATRKWIQTQAESGDSMSVITNCYNIILALTEKYDALAMNPPYMGSGAMNEVLSTYVKENYPEGKADLATVFVQLMKERTCECGKYSFIIPPSWMFLSVFELLRRTIIDTQSIDSLLHLSRGIFGADFGSSSAVITNKQLENAKGVYFRLIERTFQEFDQKHLRMLFEKTLENHDFRYKFRNYSKEIEDVVFSEDGTIIYFNNIEQQSFENIPGCPFGYWVGKTIINSFLELNQIKEYALARPGFSTGNNDRYIREWFEPSLNKIGFNLESIDQYNHSQYKYVPFTAGGCIRKWYGNLYRIVDWTTPEKMHRPRTTYMHLYFNDGITWNEVTSDGYSARYIPKGFLFEHSGVYMKVEDKRNQNFILGYLNTPIFQNILNIMNPTIHNGAEVVMSIPVPLISNSLDNVIQENITISKSDWDAHETSWDFEKNELLHAIDERVAEIHSEIYEETGQSVHFIMKDWSIKELVDRYKSKWERMFTQLHRNEEELNRRFIEIYGLQDELDYHVPFEEITILQQGEIDHDKTHWEEGRPRPENIRPENIRTENIRPENIRTGNIRPENIRPENIRTEYWVEANPCGETARGRASSQQCVSSQSPYLDKDGEIKIHGDKLPHWSQDGKMVFFTFRLSDSLPQTKIEELKLQQSEWIKKHPKPWDEETEKEYHKIFSNRIEELIDNGYGSCILRDQSVAEIVAKTLRFDDGKKYRLIGFVVMPNHVHVLAELFDSVTVDSIMQEWKSVSSHKLRKMLGDKWPGWMEKYYDRIIRNEDHQKNVIRYILKNYYSGGAILDLLGSGAPSRRPIHDTSFDNSARGRASSQLKLHWNDDVIIKQLISYAVGCMMGRYSIDKPGLILANQGDGVEQYNEIVGESRFEVDDDGIVPLMAANLELTDNAPLRFKKWLEAAFGAENLVENINYIQQALGKTIEAYFQKDFWKDHKKMYQNRPIYWLFTSKKGAFQCLVYMHRMDAYTPERIRTRYLLPHIDWLKRRQDELQQRAASLNTNERRELDNITKQIEECLEYHDRLHVVADAQQAIDLDDGVVVNYAKFGDVVAKLK